MANAAKTTITEKDLSFSITSRLTGIFFIQGISKRGKTGDVSVVQRTWAQFLKNYGGLLESSTNPLLCKLMLDAGLKLRFNRVLHYTDITNAETLTALKAEVLTAQKITFSAALVALNKYNLTINGVAIAEVTYADDSDTTMAAIATSIQNHADVLYAYVKEVDGGDTDDRVIYIISGTTEGLTLTGSAVTLGVSQATTTITDVEGILDASGNVLFNFTPKGEGSDYNNLSFVISAATNGSANYFNLAINHSEEPSLNELYENLIITGTPTANQSSYLSKVMKESNWLGSIIYGDLSDLTSPVRPRNGTYVFEGGDDGDAVVANDYVGDSGTKSGFHAFDTVDDSISIAAPEMSDTDIHTAGAAYAANRKDLVYYAHLAPSANPDTIISDRDDTLIDSSYTAFYSGGIKAKNPSTGLTIELSELPYVFINMNNSDNNVGPWASFAGRNRGVINNVLGVVNNFGGPGQYADLNALANKQINMVIERSNSVMIWGNYTAQLADSKLSFLSIRRFLLTIEKDLKPTLERYLEEPNDIPTWKSLANEADTYLKQYLTQDKKALNNYEWQGDQNADSLSEGSLTVNNPTDVGNGKYKVKLFLDMIVPIIEIELAIMVTPTGVSFEEL